MIGLLRATFAALLLAVTALPAAALLPAIPGYNATQPPQTAPLFSYPQSGYSTFYIAPGGTDGTGCGTLASPCASPNGVATNNFIACGSSQIIALTGTYSQANMTITATPFCPSQANVVWVRCAVSFACSATTQLLVEASYWGIMGWQETSASLACFLVKPPSNGQIGVVALANNIASTCAQGGIVFYQNGSKGVGETVVIGNLVYNAATGTSGCYTGITHGSMYPFLAAGDEVYAEGNYTYGNVTSGMSCNTTIYTISSGTYTSGTGAVSLTTSASTSLGVGAFFCVSSLTGTGAFASLDGCYTTTSGTTGTTVNYTAATGLGTTTITGGQTALPATDQSGLNLDTASNYTGVVVFEGNWSGWNGGPGIEVTTGGLINAGPIYVRNNTLVNNAQFANLVRSSATEIMGGNPAVGGLQMYFTFNLAQGNSTLTCNGGACVNGVQFAPEDTSPASISDANFAFESNAGCGVTGCGSRYFGGHNSLCLSGQVFVSSTGYNQGCQSGVSGGWNSFTVSPVLVSDAEPGAPSCAGYPDVFTCFANNIANLKSTAAGAAGTGAQVPAVTDQYNTTPFIRNVVAALPVSMLRSGGGPIPVR